ncbi:MAG: lactate utilization protein [Saprospiraceae bacterium]|nr:lactate utilization protein [Saprospiraceae bacterium]
MNNHQRSIDHAGKAAKFIADLERTDWHNEAISFLRTKRDAGTADLEEWEELRNLASQVKDNVLSNLDSYLLQFEEKATANGVKVHWAKDGDDHNRIVGEILTRHKVASLVKSKSMLTEECHLNQYLETQGIEVIDTDLGERIIQMRNEAPSHIVAPAIHIRKEEVGALFHEKLHTEAGASDPKYLTEAARQHLRTKFLAADAALTGVNFAIAETGGVVVCTNEGNADMGVHMCPVQIHSMGIEKIVPQSRHLGIFTRLLARSATGQPITIYTSHYQKPKTDGEMHIIIVDNGRSIHLGKEKFRNALKCIRCGACMNSCPVYRRSGGYSYGSTVPGPIGSILTPGFDLEKFKNLPFASSLCGACSDVCPVKIDIHEQLYAWRQIVYQEGALPKSKSMPLTIAGKVLARPKLYDALGKIMRSALKWMPKFLTHNRFNAWTTGRDLPTPPKQSFKAWYADNRKKN